jgi:hypothetical protein
MVSMYLLPMAALATRSGATTSCIGSVCCAGGDVSLLCSLLETMYLRGSWHCWYDVSSTCMCKSSLLCLWCVWYALVVCNVVDGMCAGLVALNNTAGDCLWNTEVTPLVVSVCFLPMSNLARVSEACVRCLNGVYCHAYGIDLSIALLFWLFKFMLHDGATSSSYSSASGSC